LACSLRCSRSLFLIRVSLSFPSLGLAVAGVGLPSRAVTLVRRALLNCPVGERFFFWFFFGARHLSTTPYCLRSSVFYHTNPFPLLRVALFFLERLAVLNGEEILFPFPPLSLPRRCRPRTHPFSRCIRDPSCTRPFFLMGCRPAMTQNLAQKLLRPFPFDILCPPPCCEISLIPWHRSLFYVSPLIVINRSPFLPRLSFWVT